MCEGAYLITYRFQAIRFYLRGWGGGANNWTGRRHRHRMVMTGRRRWHRSQSARTSEWSHSKHQSCRKINATFNSADKPSRAQPTNHLVASQVTDWASRRQQTFKMSHLEHYLRPSFRQTFSIVGISSSTHAEWRVGLFVNWPTTGHEHGSCPFFKIKFKDFSRTFNDHPRHIQGDYINPKRHFYNHI